MHYRFSGTGSNVIIFLHMSGSSSDEFELVGEKLAQSGFYVYAPDLLGLEAQMRLHGTIPYPITQIPFSLLWSSWGFKKLSSMEI